MSSAAVRAIPSANPSARVAPRFGRDADDEESDRTVTASAASAKSVARGTRILRADATAEPAEAEGRTPPTPRASAVVGTTAEANAP